MNHSFFFHSGTKSRRGGSEECILCAESVKIHP
jgi:hypothetical protein